MKNSNILNDLLEQLEGPQEKDEEESWSTKSCNCMNNNSY